MVLREHFFLKWIRKEIRNGEMDVNCNYLKGVKIGFKVIVEQQLE